MFTYVSKKRDGLLRLNVARRALRETKYVEVIVRPGVDYTEFVDRLLEPGAGPLRENVSPSMQRSVP